MTSVLAIDPAPTKASTLFDGKSYEALSPGALSARLKSARSSTNLLICWDAPLTGPTSSTSLGVHPQDYSQRRIERFFTRKENGFRVPKGISVLPYAGCPHWAVSLAVLGLPRVGQFDAAYESLPFALVSEGQYRPAPAAVVEVHPEVALCLWLREGRSEDGSWVYKGKKHKDVLEELVGVFQSLAPSGSPVPRTDDELDALVGFTLGAGWASGSGSVALLGDRSSGSFLVPFVPKLTEAFEHFRQQEVA